ncbi:MAG: ABC transporter transmembrane domain-containing protein, partial [Alkaliphilus sp.]
MDRYFKKNKIIITSIFLLKIIFCCSITIVPIFVGKVLDLGLQSINSNNYFSVEKVMFNGAALLLTIIVSYYLIIKLDVTLMRKIRQDIEYDILYGILVNSIDLTKSTNLLINEIDLLIERYFKNIIRWPNLVIPLIIGLTYTFFVSYITMLIMISVLIVVMVINQILVKPFAKCVQELEESKAETNKKMLGFLNAMTTINIFSKYEFVKTRMTQEVKEKMFKELKLKNFEVLVEAINNFFAILMQLIPMVILAVMVYNSEISIGEALSIILLFEKIVVPIEGIGNLNAEMGSISNLKKDMEKIIHVEKNEYSNMVSKKFRAVSLKFVDVSYKYHEKYVFEKLSFEIQDNKKYLLKGESASGKSTIFKILTKQITDYEGSIYINEINLRKLSKNDVYNILGVLLQKPEFIVGTVGENISLQENYDQ